MEEAMMEVARVYMFLLCVFVCAFMAAMSYLMIMLGKFVNDYEKRIQAYLSALESIKERMKIIENKEKQNDATGICRHD